MRTVVVAVLALVACDKGNAPTPTPVPPAQVKQPADAAGFEVLPASSRAAIASPPRDQWACGFDVDEDQGIVERGHAVYTFGKRSNCQIPLSLIAQGIWGCPESYVRTDESDGMRREHTITYDDHDRIATFDVQVREDFSWDGMRLISTSRTQWGETDAAMYRDEDARRIIAVDAKGQPQEVLTLEGGRVVGYDEYLYARVGATATIKWNGKRPDRVTVQALGPVKGYVTRVFRYDCPSDGKTR
jgi:hypothetical protein